MNPFASAPRKSPARPSFALAASVGIHVALIAASAKWLRAFVNPPGPPVVLVDVGFADEAPRGDVLDVGTPGASDSRRPVPREESPRSGPLRDPRPDTRTSGKGGSAHAAEPALHMSDSVDGLTLASDPTLFTPHNQISRIDTSDDRRSREDRRTTPNPMELTFVATGTGSRRERLDPTLADPAAGAHGAVPVAAGERRGDIEPASDGFQKPIPVTKAATGAVAVPALGVDHGTLAADYRRTAAVALARPALRTGRASIATTRRGRPNDTADSSQEVATLVQSLITASTAGGALGRGPGGADAEGEPGSEGASGAGARARPSGEGGGEQEAPSFGLESYAARLTRKVYPYWEDAFPIWARAEGRGGIAVIGVTLSSDGSVHDLRVVRGSGIPEFDRNVAQALAQASPYGPLPSALRRSGLTLHIAFDAMNPAVGRSGPGPGRR